MSALCDYTTVLITLCDLWHLAFSNKPKRIIVITEATYISALGLDPLKLFYMFRLETHEMIFSLIV